MQQITEACKANVSFLENIAGSDIFLDACHVTIAAASMQKPLFQWLAF